MTVSSIVNIFINYKAYIVDMSRTKIYEGLLENVSKEILNYKIIELDFYKKYVFIKVQKDEKKDE